MSKKPEIRYTQGPESLVLGDVELVRADLDTPAKRGEPSREGWREASPKIAAQALLPGRVAEYGFEARNFTPTPAASQEAATGADDADKSAGRAGARNKA